MAQEVPFFLQTDENIIKDASVIQYYGFGIINVGFGGGAIGDSGFGGGIFTSKQHKREKSVFDAVNCHVYLTNKRLVFVKASINLGATEETGLDTIFSDIPLNLIESIKPDTKFMVHATIDLSVRTPSGEINKISFAFIDTGGKKSLMSFERYRRQPERDEFLKLIELYRQKIHENIEKPKIKDDAEDPLKIIKLRYAKGEITKEEYNEMIHLLQ